MTASISTPRPAAAVPTTSFGRTTGFRALVRKELTEWRRARRTWIVFLASGLFMTLAALNNWLISVLPADLTVDAEPPILDPLMNLIGPVTTNVFAIASVFAVIALITAERESGTLAWTASKPVSRTAIWLAKFVSATGVMWVVAGILPLLATVAVVNALYGPVPVVAVAAMAVGMGMVIALFIALALAASTVVTSQAAVAGITLGMIFLAPMLGALLPDPSIMPTAVLQWAVRLGLGEPAGPLALVTWAVTVVGLVAFSVRRMERMEL